VQLIDQNGDPCQSFTDSIKWNFRTLDACGEVNPWAFSQEWLRADMSKIMNLTEGPLFTHWLLKLDSDTFIWYYKYHHVIIDLYSCALIVRRVAEIYTALLTAEPIPISLFGSFITLVQKDQIYRASVDFTLDRDFWLNYIEGAEPISLGGRSSPQRSIPVRRALDLEQPVSQSFTAVAHAHGTTVAQVLIAAIATYLYRASGSCEFLIGLPVNGRTLGTRLIVGMAANAIPLRLSLASTMSFKDVVEHISAEIRRVRRHVRFNIVDLQREFRVRGNKADLLETTVNVAPFDYNVVLAGHGVKVSNLSIRAVAGISIVVFGRAGHGELTLQIDANNELYQAEEVQNHLSRLGGVLKACAAVPDQPIGRIDLLEAKERHQILEEWNQTARAVPEATLPELFEAQVSRTPDATALIFEEQELSYAALNARANRLAHLLIGRGVGPESIVALALPRSFEMVVSLLAVLKAGAAYLPLDPDYPPERLAFMLADGRPTCVITSGEVFEQLPNLSAPHLRLGDVGTLAPIRFS